MDSEASDRSWARGEKLSKRQHEAWQVMLREQARLGRSITSAELAKALGITIHGAHYLMCQINRLGYARRVKEPGRSGPVAGRLAVEERMSRSEIMASEAAVRLEPQRRPTAIPKPAPTEWVSEHSLDLSGAQVAAVVNAFAEWRRLHDPYADDGDALAGIVGEWSAKNNASASLIAKGA